MVSIALKHEKVNIMWKGGVLVREGVPFEQIPWS